MFDLDRLPPILFAGDAPRVRESDPLTSHAAADSSDLPKSHMLVMALFAHERWLAQFEAEQLLTGILSPSRVRTAFTELEEAGRLVRTSMTVPTPYGRTAQVWEVSR
jgi:hypothetical protein